MKYFYDFEFHEGWHKPLFGRKRHFIDIISVGVVSEDGREYYAINKDFDLKAAWNSYQLKQVSGDARNTYPYGMPEYWLRVNVLKPIFYQLWNEHSHMVNLHKVSKEFTYANMRRLLDLYGESLEDIRYDLFCFFFPEAVSGWNGSIGELWNADKEETVELYGYYSAYDHVLMCMVFGKMIEMPKGLPWYTIDLKQTEDELGVQPPRQHSTDRYAKFGFEYPEPENEHHALWDARWNQRLYWYLQNIKSIGK